MQKRNKNRISIVTFLMMISLLLTTGTFAFWASYVEGTNVITNGTVTIGSADSVDTAFTISNETNSLGKLVPENQLQNSNLGAVDIVYFSYDLQWIENELKSQITGNTIVTGDVKVSHIIEIYQDNQLVPFIGNEAVYNLLHVVYNESNPTQMILDAKAETFRYTVTMDEPTNQEQYNLIANSDIVITMSFQIADHTVKLTQKNATADVPSTFTITYYDVDDSVIYSEEVMEGNDLGSFTIPADPVKEGYTFTGWSSTLPETMPANDINLYAGYIINQYTITFDVNQGTDLPSITQDFNTILYEPSEPVKEGYIFTGWYREPSYSTAYLFTTMPAYNETVYVGWTATVDTIRSTILNHQFDNLSLCQGTESANIESTVYELLNDPFVVVNYVTKNVDGTFTIDLTQSYNDTTTSITITATFDVCEEYPANLIQEAKSEIEVLIPTGLFDNIQVANLNERTKTAGINGRLQALKDKYDVTIDVIYDDSVKDNGNPLTDTTGMTGTAMGMIITITLTYEDVVVTQTFEVVASFEQSKIPDSYTIPDTFVPY
jgi:uncharacterized repeat protein (TIGR02543 family)